MSEETRRAHNETLNFVQELISKVKIDQDPLEILEEVERWLKGKMKQNGASQEEIPAEANPWGFREPEWDSTEAGGFTCLVGPWKIFVTQPDDSNAKNLWFHGIFGPAISEHSRYECYKDSDRAKAGALREIGLAALAMKHVTKLLK